jgi:hypothetical protein
VVAAVVAAGEIMLHLTSLLLCAMGSVAAGRASPRVTPGMRSFGVALKAGHLFHGTEMTVFQHTLSAGVTHAAVTQQWHAGKSSGITPTLRIRMYIDGETTASIDYPLFLAHGVGACGRLARRSMVAAQAQAE